MAKYLANEFCSAVYLAERPDSRRLLLLQGLRDRVVDALDAPFLLIGEGSSEIQKSIISKRIIGVNCV